jgi:cellulose synthase/poly-beta-1,6-N-acetylglucosamine synthase-like glycosyltransferase
LSTLHAYIQQHDPVFIASPVIFHAGKSILSVFQEIDFMTMQGITAASVSAGFHSMCNGANLAYRKDCFYKVGGFSGNEHLATGDDMLLMHKMKKTYPNKMGYIFSREAIVRTDAQKSWREFFQQRIRWASKADSYGEPVIFGVLLWVWVMNTLILAGLLLSLFEHNLLIPWLIIIAVKTTIELFFLLPVATFFKRKSLLIYFPFLQPVHLFYIVLSGWLGKFGSYEWKNRVMNTSSRQ